MRMTTLTAPPFFLLSSVAVSILLYHKVLTYVQGESKHVGGSDILNRLLFKVPGINCCSSWPLSHFLLFSYVGYRYPQTFVRSMALGALWEGIEAVMGQWRASPHHIVTSRSGTVQYSDWWAGSWLDIVMNMSGFMAGSSFQSIY
jgi:hypothetical protein